MKHVPLYLLMLTLGVCAVFGCRKDMVTPSQEEQLAALKAKGLLDSAGNPIDTTHHPIDTIHHPCDTLHHPDTCHVDTTRPRPPFPPHDTIPGKPHDSLPGHGDSTRRR